VARVPAQGTGPPLATGTAGVSGLDPRQRGRTSCGDSLGRDAAASAASLPPVPEAPLQRAATVADRPSQLATLNWSAMDHRVARGARAFMLAPIVTQQTAPVSDWQFIPPDHGERSGRLMPCRRARAQVAETAGFTAGLLPGRAAVGAGSFCPYAS